MAIDDNASYELTGYQVKDLAQKIRAKADSNSLASVATSGLYSDLTGAPTIPTVYNGTLTIQQNGTQLGTFSANQSTNETINITGGGGSSITNFYVAGNVYDDVQQKEVGIYTIQLDDLDNYTIYSDSAMTTPVSGEDFNQAFADGLVKLNARCEAYGAWEEFIVTSCAADIDEYPDYRWYRIIGDIEGFGGPDDPVDTFIFKSRDGSSSYGFIRCKIQNQIIAGSNISIAADGRTISASNAGKPILYVGFEMDDLGKLYLYKDENLTIPATGQDLLDGLEAGNNVVGYDDGGGLCYLTVSLGFEGDGDYRLFRIDGMYALPTWDYANVSTDAYTITDDDFIGVASQNYLTVAEAYYNARHTEFVWSVQQGVTSLRLFSNQSSEASLTSVTSAVNDGVATVFDSVDGGKYHLVCDNGTRFIGVKSGTNGDTMKFIVFEYRSASTPKWYKTEYTLQNGLTAGSNITISSNTISATDTTYSAFTGATSSVAGTAGLVPAPTTSDPDKFLKGDGTWATVSGGEATVIYLDTDQNHPGRIYMYKDSAKTTPATGQDLLDNIEKGCNVVSHSTGAADGYYTIGVADDSSDGDYMYFYIQGIGFQPSGIISLAYSSYTVTQDDLDDVLSQNYLTSYEVRDLRKKMSGATAYTSGSAGIVPAPAAGDQNKALKGDGTWGDVSEEFVIMKYGEANAWAKFIDAYNKNKIVYCRASSNDNPATGSQTRLAFMAYVSNETSPTNVEFQYVRSVGTKTVTQPVDQVFVYKLESTNGGTWSVQTRNMAPKIAAGTGINVSYSNGTYTISVA